MREVLDRAASLACLREQAHALLLRRNALRDDLTQVHARFAIPSSQSHDDAEKGVNMIQYLLRQMLP